jgi:hypothetical protein
VVGDRTSVGLIGRRRLRHFAIKTDINESISPDLPWAQRVAEFVKEFPQREILAVIDAPTPEFVEQAVTKLRQVLEARLDLFPQVRSGDFSDVTGCRTYQSMR